MRGRWAARSTVAHGTQFGVCTQCWSYENTAQLAGLKKYGFGVYFRGLCLGSRLPEIRDLLAFLDPETIDFEIRELLALPDPESFKTGVISLS